jgi:hypothetical protein
VLVFGTIYAAEALAEQVLPETAANYVGTGIIGTGIAQLAEGVGAGKHSIPRKTSPFCCWTR